MKEMKRLSAGSVSQQDTGSGIVSVPVRVPPEPQALSRSDCTCPGCRKSPSESAFPPIMDISQVSIYIQIPVSSIYKLIHTQAIPSFRIGRHRRFRKVALDRWLEKREWQERKIRSATKENDQHGVNI